MASRGRPARRAPGRPAAASDRPEVREALLDAARALCSRRDYRAVSVREIAAEAGVTPAMVHYYFGDKQGLYDAMLEVTFTGLLERVRTLAEARSGDGLAGLLELLIGTISAEPWIPAFVLREVISEEGRLRERFIESYASQVAVLLPGLLQGEIAAGRFRKDLDPRLAFVSLVGMTVFPFAARPILQRVLGFEYDEGFRRAFQEHTLRLFQEGVQA